MSKQVNETKASEVAPRTEIQINQGNTDILIIKLLNSINDSLIAIKESLKK